LMRPHEAAVTLVDGAVLAALERSFDAPGRLADDVVLAGLDAFHVGLDLAGAGEAVVRAAARHMHGVGARDHGLGRRAAGVDAGAAEAVALDDGDLLAGVGQSPRQARPGLASADDDRIVVGHAALRLSGIMEGVAPAAARGK